MAVGKLFVLSTHFSCWGMGYVDEFVGQILAHCFSIAWFYYATYLLPLFGFINTFFRLKKDGSSLKYYDDNFDFEYVYAMESKSNEKDGTDHEASEFNFNFKFPTFEEFSRSMRDNDDFIPSETMPSISTNNYEVVPRKSHSVFFQELEPIIFKVEEVNPEINGESKELDKNLNSFHLEGPKAEQVHEETCDKSINGKSGEESNEREDLMSFLAVDEDGHLHVFYENKGSLCMDSDLGSDGSSNLHSFTNHLADPFVDGFQSDGEFGVKVNFDHLLEVNGMKVRMHDEMPHFLEDQDPQKFNENGYIQDSDKFVSNFLSEKDFHEESHSNRYVENSGKDGSINTKNDYCDDTNKLETLWEHQDLIEQLKMELKKVRATGLPTILEESESPCMMEELKPWKINDKFHHENLVSELHKFYKSYSERMRKLDILNYQKMYAIGFLQLKDPLQSISRRKTLVQNITSFISDSLYLNKSKKNDSDPMMKYMNELGRDLEVVYVGQMCLSWEILHWQYGMALDLWKSDPHGIRCYNEVAGEFQQFQVLVQRFIEDEPFQGPRVQNYIKHRCVLRNLLQVPVIREDNTKDAKERRKERKNDKDDDYTTTPMLVEIVEESIRIFWNFVGADTECTSVRRKGMKVELLDIADSDILKEVRTDLQKKERRLKEQLRSGNWMLKKFWREDSRDQHLLFFSQVDMKLVCRVLNMPTVTNDQLGWCRNKLKAISFINKRMHVEPGFYLFPCINM